MLTETRDCGAGRNDHKLRTLGSKTEVCRSYNPTGNLPPTLGPDSQTLELKEKK